MLPPVSEKRPVSMLLLSLIYLGIYIGAAVLVIIIMMVLESMFSSSISNSSSVVIPMISAMALCQFWVKREGEPSKARRWQAAFLFTIVTFVAGAAQLWLLVSQGWMPELHRAYAEFNSGDLKVVLIILAVFFVMVLLTIRLGLGLGIGGIEKQQKKLAEKLKKRS